MQETRKTSLSSLLTITIILAIALPLIPILPQIFNLSSRAYNMDTLSITKEAVALALYYIGVFLFFFSLIFVFKNKINPADLTLVSSFIILFIAGAIQVFGLASNATYNPSQAFLSSLLPLLALVYLNKRTGLKVWTTGYTWSVIFLLSIFIAFLWLGSKIGWKRYSEIYGINSSEKSYAVVDGGTILCYLIGLVVLYSGVGCAKRLRSGLNLTSWIGLFLLIFLPIIYAFFHGEMTKKALSAVLGWWPTWTAASSLYVFAILGYYTGRWNKNFVLKKGDEERLDENSDADKPWNNY